MADALAALAARLAIPGLPDWVGLVALLVAGLALLAFLAMPFSVFGVKARLDQIEAQLDEIQTELRGLVLRQGQGSPRRQAVLEDEDWVEPPPAAASRAPEPMAPRARPPVPPPAWVHDLRPPRVEPKFDPRRDEKR